MSTSFHRNFGTISNRIIKKNRRFPPCFVRSIITDVSVSIRIRLLHQYREREKYSSANIFDKNKNKFRTPWRNIFVDRLETNTSYIYIHIIDLFTHQNATAFSTFLVTHTFLCVYVCMCPRVYMCVSVCIHIRCAFVYAYVYVWDRHTLYTHRRVIVIK